MKRQGFAMSTWDGDNKVAATRKFESCNTMFVEELLEINEIWKICYNYSLMDQEIVPCNVSIEYKNP
jgi:hypothetical protein